MKTVLHKAGSRGHANHGWLNSFHTFSFADYYDPERVNFGVLRVLNDDTVAGGEGFGRHPHKNMEIISIPLEGRLHHGDNMGNQDIISKGEIQVMSAGTGIMHSEENADASAPVKFLQIWVIPNKTGVKPRYDKIVVADNAKPDDFQQIVSPDPDDDGVWIHQDAWFSLANFNKGVSKEYRIRKPGNGVYVFIVEGKAKIGDQVLDKRDGFGVYDTDHFEVEALENSEILLMDVPMEFPE